MDRDDAIEDKPQRLTNTPVFSAELLIHSGPLPPPEVLAQYNAVIPDAAERILRMTENQVAHRIKTEQLETDHIIKAEQALVRSGIQRSMWGQSLAALVTGICLFTGYKFAELGHAVEGAGLITANIVGLATVFVIGHAKQKGDQRQIAGRRSDAPEEEQQKIRP